MMAVMPSKRQTAPELEISWRTEELGPEMRRRLFEQVVPSAGRSANREGPQPAGKEPKHSERPKGRRQARK